MSAPEAARRRCRGAVLVELMIGLTIGLLAVAAALTATASLLRATAAGRDAADLQQRADLALRLIGAQVRRAGSVRLLADGTTRRFSTAFTGWNGAGRAVSGLEGGRGRSDTLRLSFEPESTGERDVLGYQANEEGSGMDTHLGDLLLQRFDGQFLVDADSRDRRRALYASGARERYDRQALVGGVDDLQLRYAWRAADGALQYADADRLPPDATVLAVAVCLQLSSEARHGAPGAVDCQGTPLTGAQQRGRMVRLARAVFRVHNAG